MGGRLGSAWGAKIEDSRPVPGEMGDMPHSVSPRIAGLVNVKKEGADSRLPPEMEERMSAGEGAPGLHQTDKTLQNYFGLIA